MTSALHNSVADALATDVPVAPVEAVAATDGLPEDVPIAAADPIQGVFAGLDIRQLAAQGYFSGSSLLA
ncbi:MAG: hypothetical protein HC800_12400 [Phormidesmis sp. RL_2_1]|nr:hypothetical protein [Phormidesmis sp. RL_2_1]